ncbi:hypothetical protein BT96DRAFT_923982 [Gymnopus androsaceus JB14]|uniref:Uncharacterized protein n=1 Tax=Gymnopus androsaceus JB14 TaxID=1447944 RepID=A0A6A4H704_9AGAR|nr:hypothetical protein BT96DRAFT_923982 [Gymnopus androsaceus JB14]
MSAFSTPGSSSTSMTRLQTRQSSRVSITPTPITPTPSFSSRPTLRDISAARRIAELEKELAVMKAERDAANVHAVISGQEVAIWKHRFNKKAEKKDTTKRFPTDARILTSREGKKEAVADAAKKAAKKKAEAERKKKKQDTEREDILRHAVQESESTAFSGSLTSKNKRDLIDIAFSLDIETDGASLNVLHVRLNAHFDANPSLKENPRYIGLFSWKCKRDDPPKENAEPGPSSTHPRLSSPSTPTPGPSHRSPSPILHYPQPFTYQFPVPVQPRPVPRPVPHPIPHLSHDPATYFTDI